MNEKSKIYDVIIIGSGPAGYTAAVYTSRAFLKTLIISGPTPGGQLTTTSEVDNYPGFPEGILGPELLERMKKQAGRFGVEIVNDEISNIKYQISNSNDKNLKSSFLLAGSSNVYESRSVIVSTGASAKTLGIPSEEKFRGKGISYCATCDGFFFRGKNIAVLGGGDTAMEEATFLTRFAESVTIIHRREEFRASPIMVEKAKKDSKIKFLLNKEIVEFKGETTVKSIKLKDTKSKEVGDFPFDGFFVAIGHKPATEFLKGFIKTDDKGYVLINDKEKYKTATSAGGIFAAGDCVDSIYRQGIVAAGMGAMAALDAQKWLETQELS